MLAHTRLVFKKYLMHVCSIFKLNATCFTLHVVNERLMGGITNLILFISVAGGPCQWPVGGSRDFQPEIYEQSPGRATEEDHSSDES